MTPDEAAFLRAIVENPNDDAVRLVFADWLDEQGQSARADFIRVQIERANLPANDARQAKLKERDLALRKQHAKEWRSQLPNLNGISWQRFWRGFVSGAEVQRWKFYRKHADAMFAVAPIQFLRFHSLNAFDCVGLIESPHLSRLVGLDLSLSGIDDEGVKVLAGCPSLNNLRKLILTGFPRSCFRSHRMPIVTNAGALALAASPYLQNMEQLDLRFNYLGEGAKQALRERFGDRVLLS
jgi:uncharacterized protein (TIGR02996 family)